MRTYTDFPLGLNLALCTACTNDMHYTETKKSHVSIYTNLSCFQYHTTCLLLKVTAPPCVKTVNWLQVCYCVCACVCVCAHCKASWVPAERQTHRGGALPLYIPKTSGMQALLIVFSPSLSVCVCVCVCVCVLRSMEITNTKLHRSSEGWKAVTHDGEAADPVDLHVTASPSNHAAVLFPLHLKSAAATQVHRPAAAWWTAGCDAAVTNS